MNFEQILKQLNRTNKVNCHIPGDNESKNGMTVVCSGYEGNWSIRVHSSNVCFKKQTLVNSLGKNIKTEEEFEKFKKTTGLEFYCYNPYQKLLENNISRNSYGGSTSRESDGFWNK